MAAPVITYDVDKLGKVSYKGDFIGVKGTIAFGDGENKTEKIVLILIQNPAQTQHVWIWDAEDNLCRALVTTPSTCWDNASVTENLKNMMD